MRNAPLLFLPVLLLMACAHASNAKPIPATPLSKNALPDKPMTTKQKIEAIERSSAPQDKKQAAIAQLRSQGY
jgi:hypothetical protein